MWQRVSPVPAQMWQRVSPVPVCGGGARPVAVQMWQRAQPSPGADVAAQSSPGADVAAGRAQPSPGADVAAGRAQPSPGADVAARASQKPRCTRSTIAFAGQSPIISSQSSSSSAMPIRSHNDRQYCPRYARTTVIRLLLRKSRLAVPITEIVSERKAFLGFLQIEREFGSPQRRLA
jgi:hypothetical protein